jgi:nucleoside-diphosphate-sugar epimerase
VEDVARALIACQDAPDGSIYNLSSDCTWEALIERISTQLGVPKPRLRIPEFPVRMALTILEGKIRLPLTKTSLDALTRRCGYSSSRIMNDLKFRFSKPMPEAICELVG